VNFFFYNCVCVSWTVHHRCAASNRSFLTLTIVSHRWVLVLLLFILALHPCLSPNLSSQHILFFFYINVCIVCARARRYTLTVDDRREMGGDEASHTSTDHQRDENWKK
jgi:hypothetical protein